MTLPVHMTIDDKKLDRSTYESERHAALPVAAVDQ
jgi:hypothetical protein